MPALDNVIMERDIYRGDMLDHIDGDSMTVSLSPPAFKCPELVSIVHPDPPGPRSGRPPDPGRKTGPHPVRKAQKTKTSPRNHRGRDTLRYPRELEMGAIGKYSRVKSQK